MPSPLTLFSPPPPARLRIRQRPHRARLLPPALPHPHPRHRRDRQPCLGLCAGQQRRPRRRRLRLCLSRQRRQPQYSFCRTSRGTQPLHHLSTGPIPQVCYCVTDGTSGPPASGCTNATLTSCAPPSVIAVQVNLQAVVTPIVHYPGLPATYTVNAQATMGVAQ